MPDSVHEVLRRLGMIPGNPDAPSSRLYRNALEATTLTLTDCLTIRDLCMLCGNDDLHLHALLICMFNALNEGSVCIDLGSERLQRKLAPLFGSGAKTAARELLKKIDSYRELIAAIDEEPGLFNEPAEEYKPLILQSRGTNRTLYFHKYYLYERRLAGSLTRLLSSPDTDLVDATRAGEILGEVLVDNPLRFNDRPARLDPLQIMGLVLPLLRNFVIVSGGPGTGKTSIVINVLRIFVRLGYTPDTIAIAAPTGRAAQRLTDSIARGISSLPDKNGYDDALAGIQGSTIHRLLRFSPATNSFIHHADNPLSARLIIVDEVSMVDIALLASLLDATAPGAKILFLGDRDQLPSVDAGAILADLTPGERSVSFSPAPLALARPLLAPGEANILPSAPETANPFTDRVVILARNYRSEQNISRIAGAINAQETGVADQLPAVPWQLLPRGKGIEPAWPFASPEAAPPSGVFLVKIGSTNLSPYRELLALLSSWMEHHFFTPSKKGDSYAQLVAESAAAGVPETPDEIWNARMRRLFGLLELTRIITPLRNGSAGTAGINSAMIDQWRMRSGFTAHGSLPPGVPVVVTRNDYARNLYNGDTGILLPDARGALHVVFYKGGVYVPVPLDYIQAYEPAFAITVHKSQGSEFDRVLLVVPDGVPEKLLTREILYTGLTRARSHAVFYASTKTLTRGIATRIERLSGLTIEGSLLRGAN